MKRLNWAALVAAGLLFPVAPVAAEGTVTADGETTASVESDSCDLRATAQVLVEGSYEEPDPDATVDAGSCEGIRPGQMIRSPIGRCTMAWVLTDGTDLYAATAGHCGAVGQEVWLAEAGVGPDNRTGNIALGPATTPIGVFVYAQDRPIGDDFGVFRIYPEVAHLVDPALCGWGGATSLEHPQEGFRDGEDVRHFGTGLLFGEVQQLRQRSGSLVYVNATAFAFEGAAAPGDSGSPAMMADGAALGIISDASGIRTPDTGPIVSDDPNLALGSVVGTRLDHGIARVEEATGITLWLVTAPLAEAEATLLEADGSVELTVE